MFNPTVYGRSSSAPHLGVLGVSGLNWDEIIKQGKEKIEETTGEHLDLSKYGNGPGGAAEKIGKEIAAAHGEATGKAAGGEIWGRAKPFAIGGLLLLGGIFVIMVLRKKKR